MRRGRALRRRIPTSGAVDDLQWMTAISSLSDEEVDELLDGHTPDGLRDLAPLADVTAALHRRAAEERAPVMRYPLRHAVARAASAPAPPRPHRIAYSAVGGAALVAFGWAGAAAALPAPVQNAVADVGSLVGVHVPRADDDDPLEVHDHSAVSNPAAVTEAEDEGTQPKAIAPPGTTPGGATPADPGVPGDLTPATPATPPEPDAGSDAEGAEPPEVDGDDTSVSDGPATPGGDPADDNADDGSDNADDGGDNGDDGSEAGDEHAAAGLDIATRQTSISRAIAGDTTD